MICKLFIFVLIICLIFLYCILNITKKTSIYGGKNLSAQYVCTKNKGEKLLCRKLKSFDLDEDQIEDFVRQTNSILDESTFSDDNKDKKIYALANQLNDKLVKNIIDNPQVMSDLMEYAIYDACDDRFNGIPGTHARMNQIFDQESLHIYICPKCGSSDHSIRELQIRAIDEPPDTFAECHICGTDWHVN